MQKVSFRLLAALGCLLCCHGTAQAAQVPCFGPESLPGEALGICITEVPGSGTLQLGDRAIRSGDVLTADQAAQVVFCSQDAEASEEVSYLPVFPDGTRATAVLSLGRKKNEAPIAEDFAAETYKNLELQGTLRVREPEQEPMTFTLVREPRRGTVVLSPDGSFTYTPKKNKVGIDSFVYTAADPGENISREATVTIEILRPTKVPQYVDTAGRSCSFAAEWMKHTGLFIGETLGGSPCFQPDKPVTRGEFLSVLVRALDIPLDGTLETQELAGVPLWLRPYAAAALRSGLTAGLPQPESMDVSAPVSGAEAAVMVQNALDLPVPASVAEDQEALPAWAEPALSALGAKGFSLDAETSLTRGQAAELLCGLLKDIQ